MQNRGGDLSILDENIGKTTVILEDLKVLAAKIGLALILRRQSHYN